MCTLKRFCTVGTFAVALSLPGCLFSPKTSPPGEDPPDNREYLERTSPENVLFNLELAHDRRDYDAYRDQMDSTYVFIPAEDDPNVDYEQLSYLEDQAVTEKMFFDVESVDLRLTHPSAEPSDFAIFPASEGYRKIEVTNVSLRVATREIVNGTQLIYLVPGDPALFIFKPDSTQSPVSWRVNYQADKS